GEPSEQDHHVSDLVLPAPGPPRHHVAFVAPVRDYRPGGATTGALLALVDWSLFQELIAARGIKDYFRGLVGEDVDPSPYGWIWAADGDTILGHVDPEVVGEKVSGPRVGLPQMVEDALSSDWGLYREYRFQGKLKNAAYKHTLGPADGGFGWIVGVGIDNADIEAATGDLRALLYRGTLAVLLTVVLWVLVVARRTTRPILALEAHTRKVAAGDLGARIEVRSSDEVGRLAEAFNRMTAELAEQRARLVEAEKASAWREMARQIAHEIKNPLTPMQLSLDLLERARRDASPEREELLGAALELMRRQVTNLSEIATDFYEFTGGAPPAPERFSLAGLAREVLTLHRAWSDELGVAVTVEGDDAELFVDRRKLRRVLTNLVANALQAMP
ncbi:MAG TPA: HAMP domain-containing protein, partial [Planctomycetota bacterium]|nr:HAMP domain-containing protein [Planctomycetota bacterium]